MSDRLQIFRVTEQLLREALFMPANARIVRVLESPGVYRGDFMFVAECPDLPAVVEGDPIPEHTPSITSYYYLCGEMPPKYQFIERTWKW